MTSTCLTHHGAWDASSRAQPALAFIERYSDAVDSQRLDGPFSAWYAASCSFHNADGAVHRGGDAIWAWMKGLFAPFRRVRHHVRVARLVDAPEAAAVAQWVILEAETAFTPHAGPPVRVPRLLMFLVGPSEVAGQGTDGLQILEAKVWWDSGALQRALVAQQPLESPGVE